MLTNYIEAELIQMITNQIEENLHLDYKGAGSLAASDGKKRKSQKTFLLSQIQTADLLFMGS